MLDESQETSPFQNIIFELLAKKFSWQNAAFFIVGDPNNHLSF